MQPVEFAVVSLEKPDGTVLQSTASDAQGRFSFGAVPAGRYRLSYHSVGLDGRTTPAFTLDARHPRADYRS